MFIHHDRDHRVLGQVSEASSAQHASQLTAPSSHKAVDTSLHQRCEATAALHAFVCARALCTIGFRGGCSLGIQL
eukprot:m.99247 g.99247  ORF g.99247 m.99247 type:complete len:75 (+) comp10301_c0_seq4:1609-1833(+)